MKNLSIKTKKYKSGINGFTKATVYIILVLAGLYILNKFFDSYRLRSPILLKIQSPIEKRYQQSENKKKSQEWVKFKQISASTIKDPAQEAIYIYFGKDKVAYAVARAESGLTCHKTNYNKNGTVDRGLFQINSIHDWRFKKFNGDPYNCWDNAKVAAQIVEEQKGWGAWVAYTSGSYLSFLNK